MFHCQICSQLIIDEYGINIRIQGPKQLEQRIVLGDQPVHGLLWFSQGRNKDQGVRLTFHQRLYILPLLLPAFRIGYGDQMMSVPVQALSDLIDHGAVKGIGNIINDDRYGFLRISFLRRLVDISQFPGCFHHLFFYCRTCILITAKYFVNGRH